MVNTFTFTTGDSLRNTGYTSTSGPTVTLSAPIAGDVTADGSELIIWRTSWDSIVKVDCRNSNLYHCVNRYCRDGRFVMVVAQLMSGRILAINSRNGCGLYCWI